MHTFAFIGPYKDAYFENAQDWAYQKNVERNGGYKKDYTSDPSAKQLGESMQYGVILYVWF